MYFTQEVIEKLREEQALVPRRYEALMLSYDNRDYLFSASEEYVRHGFLRRIGTLARCIENVFRVLPPGNEEIPDREKRLDATINIQAFVFNVFGAFDNLAWVWITETKLTKKGGEPVPPALIGFGPKNSYVRQSLPQALRDHLISMDAWFRNLEDFRHSLAHRIPLYIPPYIVSPNDEEEWRAFERQILEASLRGDTQGKGRLEAEQRRICRFRPWISHSLAAHSRPIIFHTQLIIDFMTLEKFASRLLSELPR